MTTIPPGMDTSLSGNLGGMKLVAVGSIGEAQCAPILKAMNYDVTDEIGAAPEQPGNDIAALALGNHAKPDSFMPS